MKFQKEKMDACLALRSGSELIETTTGTIEVALRGEGYPVLLSHGGGGGYDMGVWLGELIGTGFQYISPSRFGYLRSPLPDSPSPEIQADHFASLLDTLNINAAVIIGLSAGGASALQFAYHYPDRCKGLILLSAISRSLPPLPLVLRMIYPFLLKFDFVPWLINEIAPEFIYRSNGIDRKLMKEIKQNAEKMQLLEALFPTSYPASVRRDGIVNDQQQCTELEDQFLVDIHVPTLVIHAVNDPIVPYKFGEFSAHQIPDAEFLSLPRGGHFCAVSHREVVVLQIRQFIQRCSG